MSYAWKVSRCFSVSTAHLRFSLLSSCRNIYVMVEHFLELVDIPVCNGKVHHVLHNLCNSSPSAIHPTPLVVPLLISLAFFSLYDLSFVLVTHL